jgi:hypothetical protein
MVLQRRYQWLIGPDLGAHLFVPRRLTNDRMLAQVESLVWSTGCWFGWWSHKCFLRQGRKKWSRELRAPGLTYFIVIIAEKRGSLKSSRIVAG